MIIMFCGNRKKCLKHFTFFSLLKQKLDHPRICTQMFIDVNDTIQSS